MKNKKELKEEYRQMKSRMGVFQIRNAANGRIYVEASPNMEAKWNRYRFQLNFGSHPNRELQEDWKALGEDQFRFEILAELEQKEEDKGIDYVKELKVLEELYLEELEPFGDKGYNAMPK